MEGFVKWFSSKKGWGFITGQDGEDYFAHWTRIEGEGYRFLVDDEEVEFEPSKDDKNRRMASQIIRKEVA